MAQRAQQITRIFARTAHEASRARRLVGRWLEAWGLGPVRSTLELVAGELLSNAVHHGRGPIELSLSADRGRVRLAVCDHGGGTPHLRTPRRTGPSAGGWGLRLVDQLTDMWGTEVAPGRTRIWAELAYRRHAEDPAPPP